MIVVAYSAADVAWMRRLQYHLPQKAHAVELESAAGALPPLPAEARVVVLLMSPELVAQGRALASLLEAQPGLKVVSLSVRECDHGSSPLAVHRAVLNHWYPLAKMDFTVAERALAAAAGRLAGLEEDLSRAPILKRYRGSRGTEGLGGVPEARGLPPQRKRGRPRREPVRLGASAPRIVKPGQEFTARFAAYHPALAAAIKRHLRKAGAGSIPHLDDWSASWRWGTAVKVQVSGDGLDVSPASQDFVWEGQQHSLDFDVRARRRSARYDTRLKFDVSIEGMVLARLRLDLTVAEPRRARRAWSGRRRPTFLVAPKTAFASYAAEDRPRVLDRVAAIRIAAGVDVFMDCLELRPLDAWRTRLETEICRRDVFMLFWSESAAWSKWVDWEWRYALERKGLDAMQAHPLDPWPKAPLPQELSSLHMGDPLMAVRQAALTAV